ncbi:MAG: DNA topoisomerase 4 subunit A, partial [Rhodobacteraceae bacterium]|nr:DNA topoisomerase 4 subunit A [Paracoccaceae bacterium]
MGPGVSIVDELRSAYLDYAMSVIVSRAIPDLRDGLKPVHRRILYAMHETGNSHDKAFRKSARPVGDVMGKYHPHGDAAIYDALVRMAQDFSMSLPLLGGQGNFGSMDGDNPAAMRYTEVRMAKAAQWLLADIDRNTVTFQDNYDGKDQEPVVLPARFPNLLINGGGGIAVGMATNIPPHNLGEVIDATLALIDNPDISIEALMECIPAPDFPTGGIIQGRHGAAETYATGRGKIVIRAKTRIEEAQKDRQAIIIEEVPYQVNKASMIERIAQSVRDKKVEGISSIRDESDRSGVRVVIDLKRDATAEVVLNQLWKNSQMQTHFSCNMLALNGGRPERMPLDTILRSFVEFREDVVSRRTADELSRARTRSHLLCGLAVAASNIDEVVHIIRSSSEPAAARERLQERSWPATEIADYVQLIDDPLNAIRDDGTYRLSDEQARAILELRLQRLTALGIRETGDELQKLAEKIRECLDILASASRIRSIISNELREVKELFAVPRRTQISEYADDIDDEDLIEPEDVVVTITNGGYIKRT